MSGSIATVNYLTVRDTVPTPKDIINIGNHLDQNKTGAQKKEKETKIMKIWEHLNSHVRKSTPHTMGHTKALHTGQRTTPMQMNNRMRPNYLHTHKHTNNVHTAGTKTTITLTIPILRLSRPISCGKM